MRRELLNTVLKDQTKLAPHTDMVLETDVLLSKLMEMLEKCDQLADMDLFKDIKVRSIDVAEVGK